jgi:hypothetical protein
VIQALRQLNGANTTLIPDNYRAEQIAFINSDPARFPSPAFLGDVVSARFLMDRIPVTLTTLWL